MCLARNYLPVALAGRVAVDGFTVCWHQRARSQAFEAFLSVARRWPDVQRGEAVGSPGLGLKAVKELFETLYQGVGLTVTTERLLPFLSESMVVSAPCHPSAGVSFTLTKGDVVMTVASRFDRRVPNSLCLSGARPTICLPTSIFDELQP